MKLAREGMVLVGVLILTALLLGIVMGLVIGGPPPPPPTYVSGLPVLTALPPPASPTAPPTQISVLILGVDSLALPLPNLEACWVITFKSDTPQYYLLGIPVTTAVTLPNSQPFTLRELYTYDIRNSLNHLFLYQALNVLTPGLAEPKAVLMIDQAGLSQVVDLLGGVMLADQFYSGASVLAQYNALPSDSAERQALQTLVLLTLLQQARDRDYTPATLVAYLNVGQWYPDYASAAQLAETAPPFQPWDMDSPIQDVQFVPVPFETSARP